MDPDKVTFGTYYHAFTVASQGTEIPGVSKKDMYVPTMEQMDPQLKQRINMSPEQEPKGEEESKGAETNEKAKKKKLSQILESHIYLTISKQCVKCDQEIKEEEIISLFSRNMNNH